MTTRGSFLTDREGMIRDLRIVISGTRRNYWRFLLHGKWSLWRGEAKILRHYKNRLKETLKNW
ncbi:MAG: hypothetical protein UT86_C0007G0009 [Candidatus Magasanikbacteria bacterium GW2011_GWC2_40_17]|uniref:Uncharacterized protein n=1 Tax=Candidatus Magasanikbacteria bacterium GW2011_GWA2_42_32 TaxID=1619039 RepID=A0A0G1D387_9BACT|nr:MAG: hypothetical protein UT86_C0007G0009 [Candidatus Magasanikbacteria bacterium GW2011_GWC2_40_17]KKS56468.1 MAG: hypothetical protein UV20_C0011G0009 [Candidatus Magasanikbacteria bacterium GW2011_GWA2_42_32]